MRSSLRNKIYCKDPMPAGFVTTAGIPICAPSPCTGRCWVKGALCLAFLALLIFAAVIAGCTTDEDSSGASEDMFILSAAEHYEEALERTREDWKGDAYLSTMTASVVSCTRTGPPPRLTYMFESPSAPESFYVLDLIQGGWAAEPVDTGPRSAERLPIERDDWLLDSVDAWAIAQANGGQDFVRGHQDPLPSMAVTLDYWRVGTEQNVLAWRVDYFILYGPALDLLIDPKTGEVLDVIADEIHDPGAVVDARLSAP